MSRTRLSCDVDQETKDRLEKFSRSSNMTEAVRRLAKMGEMIQAAEAEGGVLLLRDKAGTETRIVLI